MGISISDAIKEYLLAKQNSITIKTYRWYDQFLSTFLDWCNTQDTPINEMHQIEPVHFHTFVAESNNQSTYTRHHRAQIVKGFLRWCSEDEDMGVKRRMVERLSMPKVEISEVTIFTDQEIDKLLRACARTRQPHRNRAIVLMLLDTGIRASELCVDNSRPSEQTGLLMDGLFIAPGKESYIWVMGKGRKARTIKLGHETALAVQRYLSKERGHHHAPYVFLSTHGDGEPLSVRMLQQLLDELGQLAGVEDVHPHRFRHHFAVSQLLNGVSDQVLMRLLGHSTLDSTKIYTRAMSQIQARQLAVSVVDQMRSRKRK